MSKWDVFYSEYLGYKEHYQGSSAGAVTIPGSGSVTLTAAGMELTMSTTGNTNYLVGTYVTIAEAAKTTAYCIIVGNMSSNRIHIVQVGIPPTDAIGTQYTLGTATITMTSTPVGRLRIDLSDVPPEVSTYKYLVMGCATASRDATGQVKLWITGATDPHAEVNGSTYQELAITSPSTSSYQDKALFNSAFEIDVTAGSSKEFIIWTAAGASTKVRADMARMIAYRVDSTAGMFVSTGTGLSTQSAATSVGPSGATDVLTISSGSITSSSYFIICACTLSCNTTGDTIVGVVKRGSTEYANPLINVVNVSDKYQLGYLGYTTTPSSSDVKLHIKNQGASGTISCTSYYLAVFTEDAIPAWASTSTKTTGGGTDQTGITTDYWSPTDATTNAYNMWSTMCLEVVSSDIRPTTEGNRWRARLRSLFGGGVYSPDRGSDWGTTNRTQGFMFRRWQREPGQQNDLALDLMDANGSSTITGRNTAFVMAQEVATLDTIIPDEAYKTVVANIESGMVLKNWESTSETDVYKKYLSDVLEISRILRNSTEVTISSTLPSWSGASSDTGYWDSANKTVYIKMPSGKMPSDYDQTVIVVLLLRYGRSTIDLKDGSSNGSYYKYTGRARNVPGSTSSLDVRGGGSQASFSIGNLDLVTTDGYFKDLISQRIWEGLRAKILMGYGRIHPDLASFKIIMNGIMGMPQQSNDIFRIKLLDRSAILQKPLANVGCTVYVGGSSTFGYQEKQVLPLVFGTVKRIPAYRVSHYTGTTASDYNYYKYASNSCKSVSAVYEDTDTSRKVASSAWTDYAPDLGLIKAQNTGLPNYNSSDRIMPDVLYVDVVGHTNTGVSSGTALLYPGEIAYYLLTRFPMDIDATLGTTYAIGGAGFTLTDSGGMAVTTASVPGSTWYFGDRLLAVDSTKRAHLQIVEGISGTSWKMIPLHEPGDSPDGTVFSTSGTIRKVTPGYNGINAKDMIFASFRNIDSGRWRSQLQNGVLQLQAPKIGLVVTGETSSADALSEIGRITFSYWYMNRLGRIGFGLPDEEFGNLLLNPGFEWDPDGEWYWPWSASNGATVALTSSRKFEGYRSIEVSNQSSMTSYLSQDVVFDRPGKYVATAMGSLKSGNGGAFRIAVVPPGRERMHVSDPVVITNSRWERATVKFEIKPGQLGSGRFIAIPYAPDDYLKINPSYTTNLLTNIGGESAFGFYSNGELIGSLNDMDGNADLVDFGSDGNNYLTYELNPFNRNRPRFRLQDNKDSNGTSLISLSSTLSETNGFTVSFIWTWDGRSDATERTIFGVYGKTFRVGVMSSGGSSGINFHDSGGYGSVYTTLVPGKTYLITVTHNASTTNLYINGATSATSTRSHSALSQTGYLWITAGSGLLGQIIAYDEVLSSTNRAIVETYLQERWGCVSTSVAVDNCQLFRVAAFVDDTNADFQNIDFKDEIYPEVRVTYDVNTSKQDFAGSAIVSDTESQLLVKSIPEGKNAIQTSKRLDITGALLKDSASAAGVAAAAAGYFGRQRQAISLKLLGEDEIPEIGDKIYIDMTQAPEALDGNKLWRVTNVDYNGENSQVIEITAERQIDSVSDRIDISPVDIPLGAIVLTDVVDATFGSGAGYVEVTAMQDYFVAGSSAADLTTIRGSSTHTHTFTHTHAVPAHTHTFTLGDLTATTGWALSLNNSIGPAVSVASETHTHTVAPATYTTNPSSSSLTSSATSVTSNLGPNDPKHYRVRFLKRTSGTAGAFSSSMIVGYLYNAVPSGWTRVTAMDGYYLRGATTFTGVSTTLGAGGYTKSDTSTSVVVGTSANMRAGMRLVFNSNINVVVDSVTDGTHIMVRALNMTSDASSASPGASVVSASEAVTTATTPSNHDHTGSIASHTHTFSHSHSLPNANINFSSGPNTPFVSGFATSARNYTSTTSHLHSLLAGEGYSATYSSACSGATGSAVQSVASTPDVYKIVWMKSSGSVSELPAGAIVFWDGSVCPTGYTRLAEADDLLIGSAETGADAASSTSGHAHTFTAASHSADHSHSNTNVTVGPSSTYTDMAAGGASNAALSGHYHNVTASAFSTATVTMPSSTGNTSTYVSGSSSLPLHRRLILCKKD